MKSEPRAFSISQEFQGPGVFAHDVADIETQRPRRPPSATSLPRTGVMRRNSSDVSTGESVFSSGFRADDTDPRAFGARCWMRENRPRRVTSCSRPGSQVESPIDWQLPWYDDQSRCLVLGRPRNRQDSFPSGAEREYSLASTSKPTRLWEWDRTAILVLGRTTGPIRYGGLGAILAAVFLTRKVSIMARVERLASRVQAADDSGRSFVRKDGDFGQGQPPLWPGAPTSNHSAQRPHKVSSIGDTTADDFINSYGTGQATLALATWLPAWPRAQPMRRSSSPAST